MDQQTLMDIYEKLADATDFLQMSVENTIEAKAMASEAQFNSLLMATILTATGANLAALAAAFPEEFAEVMSRIKAPGGALNNEEMKYIIGR